MKTAVRDSLISTTSAVASIGLYVGWYYACGRGWLPSRMFVFANPLWFFFIPLGVFLLVRGGRGFEGRVQEQIVTYVLVVALLGFGIVAGVNPPNAGLHFVNGFEARLNKNVAPSQIKGWVDEAFINYRDELAVQLEREELPAELRFLYSRSRPFGFITRQNGGHILRISWGSPTLRWGLIVAADERTDPSTASPILRPWKEGIFIFCE